MNNAGRSAGSPVASSNDAFWREDYQLKVISSLHVSRRVLPALEVDQGRDCERARDHGRHPPREFDPDHRIESRGTRVHQGARQRGRPEGNSRQRHPDRTHRIGTVGAGRQEASNIEFDEFYEKMAQGSNIPLGRIGRADEFADLRRSCSRPGPVTSPALGSASTAACPRSSDDRLGAVAGPLRRRFFVQGFIFSKSRPSGDGRD